MLESLEILRDFEAFSMPGILKMPEKPPIRNLSFCFGLYRKSQIKSVYIAVRMKKANRRLQNSEEYQGESAGCNCIAEMRGLWYYCLR